MATAGEAKVLSDSRAASYRAAEQSVWERYGLSPVEQVIELAQSSARIRVVEVGSGPPVLLVPGSGGTAAYWAPLVARLTRFRCLMVDRPGWGLSSPVVYTSETYAATVTAILGGVLERLDIARADVIGASIGGAWALRLAQRRPSAVGRVVVLGGSPTQEVDIPRFIKLLRSPFGALIVRLPMSEARIRELLRGLGHGATLEAGGMDDLVAWRMAFHRYTNSLHHERDMVRAIVGPNGFRDGITFAAEELGSIQHPTLMLFGTEDPTGSATLWHEFVAMLPAGKLDLVDGAGHLLWWDDPALVAQKVADFFMPE